VSVSIPALCIGAVLFFEIGWLVGRLVDGWRDRRGVRGSNHERLEIGWAQIVENEIRGKWGRYLAKHANGTSDAIRGHAPSKRRPQ